MDAMSFEDAQRALTLSTLSMPDRIAFMQVSILPCSVKSTQALLHRPLGSAPAVASKHASEQVFQNSARPAYPSICLIICTFWISTGTDYPVTFSRW